MFQEMRLKQKQMTQEETEALLARGLYGVISCMGKDGYPYGVPVNYVYREGCIYFHCAKDVGHKIENFKFCDKVCFTVVDCVDIMKQEFNTKFESAVVFGTICAADNAAEIFHALVEKYSPEFQAEGDVYMHKSGHQAAVYCIKPVHITGKAKR